MSSYPPNTALPIYGAYTQVSAQAADLEARLLTAGSYNVRDVAYGAKADGATDDTAAIQAAINACSTAGGGRVTLPGGTYRIGSLLSVPAGVALMGAGDATILSANRSGAQIATLAGRNLVSDCQVIGTYAAGFDIQGDDCTIRGVRFNDSAHTGDQCVRVFTANRLLVTGCTFDGAGYCVVQQAGYASNQGRVIGNSARDLRADFVELNSASVASAEWVIANNVYAGAHGFPTTGTELRFLGVTNCTGLTVTGNQILNTAGDAAIHLEGTSGLVSITGNTFRNCVGSGGNSGYIYLLTSTAQVVIEGNTVAHDDTSLPAAYLLDMSTGTYTGPVVVTGNLLVGNASRTLGVVRQGLSQSAHLIVSQNIGTGLGTAVPLSNSGALLMTGNDFDCANGVDTPTDGVGGAGSDGVIANNIFRATTRAIYLQANTNGTHAPTRWIINGNRIVSGSVQVDDGVDILVTGNAYPNGTTFTATVSHYGTPTRISTANNVAFT